MRQNGHCSLPGSWWVCGAASCKTPPNCTYFVTGRVNLWPLCIHFCFSRFTNPTVSFYFEINPKVQRLYSVALLLKDFRAAWNRAVRHSNQAYRVSADEAKPTSAPPSVSMAHWAPCPRTHTHSHRPHILDTWESCPNGHIIFFFIEMRNKVGRERETGRGRWFNWYLPPVWNHGGLRLCMCVRVLLRSCQDFSMSGPRLLKLYQEALSQW